MLYANRHFLEWSGYDNLAAIEAAGGLNTLFAEPGADTLAETGGAQALSIMTQHGGKLAVEGRMFTVPWNGVVGARAHPDQRPRRGGAADGAERAQRRRE